jgi:hypothetical protein
VRYVENTSSIKDRTRQREPRGWSHISSDSAGEKKRADAAVPSLPGGKLKLGGQRRLEDSKA